MLQLESSYCLLLSMQLYESQNIYFVLVGIEVWTDAERIAIDVNNSTSTLNNFLTYRKNNINSVHYNDNAQLITYDVFLHYVFVLFLLSCCELQLSGFFYMGFLYCYRITTARLCLPCCKAVRWSFWGNGRFVTTISQIQYALCRVHDASDNYSFAKFGKDRSIWDFK